MSTVILKERKPKKAEIDQKSVNLQYNNTLGCWVDGPNDWATKRLMFQLSFFFS
jgi:hypothetical protein